MQRLLLFTAILVVASTHSLDAQAFELLSIGSTGRFPKSGVVRGADGCFYGTTRDGGWDGRGSVFKITPSGAVTTLHSFGLSEGGSHPFGGLTPGRDGNFYGSTTRGWWTNRSGTLFKITPSGVLTTLHEFADENADFALTSMVQGTDGAFYGIRSQGGAHRMGMLYRITEDGSFTALHHFSGGDGASPQGALQAGRDHAFYGTTASGGAHGKGTVFRLPTSGSLSTLHSFAGGDDGATPLCGLARGRDDSFYGTASSGGVRGGGTVFRITSSGRLTTLHSFDLHSGAGPATQLTRGTDGAFYGTTTRGGMGRRGVFYKITPAGEVTLLRHFTAADQVFQVASLAQGADGAFYGTGDLSGAHGAGGVFRLTADGGMSTLHSFEMDSEQQTLEGLEPGMDGCFYGVSKTGGKHQRGMVLKVTPSGVRSTLHAFHDSEGAYPVGELLRGPDGHFYGMTMGGGTGGRGTVFRVTRAGALTTLRSFDGRNGARPGAGLVQGTGRWFYGTTIEGGAHGKGTVFRINAAGLLETLHSFAGVGGAAPRAALVLGADGNLYGTTAEGGPSNLGTVFRITPSGGFTLLHAFDGSGGAGPAARLHQGADGAFYGTTLHGGQNGYGTVFRIRAEGRLETLHSFQMDQGAHPDSGLTPGPGGVLIGTTFSGGRGGQGTLYQISPAGEHSVLHFFDDARTRSHAGLRFGGDGFLYGTAQPLAVWRIRLSGPDHGMAVHIGSAAGARLQSGEGRQDFGAAVVGGAGETRTFVVRNTGSMALNGLAAAVVAADDGMDFTLDAAGLPGTLAPGAEGSFSVVFTPGRAGARTARMEVYHAGEGARPFVIHLRGLGAPAALSFSQPVFTAHQGDTSASITVVRAGSLSGAVVGVVYFSAGAAQAVPPFSAGLAGRDHPAVPVRIPVMLAEGRGSATISLPLLPRAGSNVPNIRLSLILSPAVPGALARGTLQILAADRGRPALSVITPATGTPALGRAWPLRVYGVAGDAHGVDHVELSLNGGPPVRAVLGTGVSPLAVPWSLGLHPTPGLNTLAVTARDLRGNSSTVVRSFTFGRQAVLTVTPVAAGGRQALGTVALAAMPAGAATALLPPNPEAHLLRSVVVPGTRLRLTAAARAGHVFSHWESSPPGAAALGHELTFTMPVEGASVRAVFLRQPFAPSVAGAATFHGLLRPVPGVAAGSGTVGFFAGTIVPATGAFTGSLMMAGAVHRLAGSFYGDGSFIHGGGGARSHERAVGTGRLRLRFQNSGIQVDLDDGGEAAVSGHARRAAYSAAARVPGAYLNHRSTPGLPARDQGRLTAALPALAQPPRDLGTYPQGDGGGMVTVGGTGMTTFTGVLADGTGFTAASACVADDGDRLVFPFHAALHDPGGGTGRRGSVGGMLAVDLAIPADATRQEMDLLPADATQLLWIRPAVTSITSGGSAGQGAQPYPAGWPGGIMLGAAGNFYHAAASLESMLGLSAAMRTVGNARLALRGGGLHPGIEITALNLAGNTVTRIPPADGFYTLGINRTAGVFSGTFTPNWPNPAAARPVFQGILIQDVGGRGFFISNPMRGALPESGSVTLGAP